MPVCLWAIVPFFFSLTRGFHSSKSGQSRASHIKVNWALWTISLLEAASGIDLNVYNSTNSWNVQHDYRADELHRPPPSFLFRTPGKVNFTVALVRLVMNTKLTLGGRSPPATIKTIMTLMLILLTEMMLNRMILMDMSTTMVMMTWGSGSPPSDGWEWYCGGANPDDNCNSGITGVWFRKWPWPTNNHTAMITTTLIALFFRCASISWFQVVREWVRDVFTASASTGLSDLFYLFLLTPVITRPKNKTIVVGPKDPRRSLFVSQVREKKT